MKKVRKKSAKLDWNAKTVPVVLECHALIGFSGEQNTNGS